MSTLTIAPTARKLGRKAIVTTNGLEIVEGMKFEQWIEIGKHILAAQNSSRWWLADWLFYGETEYGRKYREALAFTGLDYQTLADLNYVAGRIDLSRRRENLSFSHHREVAPLAPAEQDSWLIRAESEGLSVMALRETLRGRRELPTGGSVARLTFSVEPSRAERWQAKAEAEGKPFDEWAAQALDEAAGVA